MSALDTLSMAFKNLYKRKLRTFLTVLGVVVGACAIIIMISLGLAINQSFDERMMASPNATIIEIWNYEVYNGYNKSGAVLDDKMFEKIMTIPNVEAVTPMMNFYIKSTIGRYTADLQVVGVYPEALPYLGYVVAEGSPLTADEEYGILFGSNVPASYKTPRERNNWRWWMDDGTGEAKVNVLKDRIKISIDDSFGEEYYYGDEGGYSDYEDEESTRKIVKPINAKGVGILEAGSDWRSTSYVFMNVSTVKKLTEDKAKWQQSMYSGYRATETYGYPSGYVKCVNVNSVAKVIENLEKLGFINGQNVYSETTYINELKDTMSSLQTLLGTMGIISLFIATIGISNTMIMSTVERTKEIGVMKVIGASIKDIRKLFLLESAIIGLFGGVLGVGVSYGVSHFLNENGLSFFSMIEAYGQAGTSTVSLIPLWLSGASLGFSAVIGLVAGFFPAQRATRLSALSAIRSQ